MKNEISDRVQIIKKAILCIYGKLKESRIGWIFTLEEHISRLWKNSRLYKWGAFPVVKIKALRIYIKEGIMPVTLGVFLGALGCVPQRIWFDWYIIATFLVLSAIYILSASDIRNASSYWFVLVAGIIGALAAFIALDWNEGAAVIVFLIAAVCFSSLTMFVIDNEDDLIKILRGVYFSVCFSSAVAAAEIINGGEVVNGTMQTPVDNAQWLILYFPLALCYTLTRKKLWEKFLYSLCIVPAFLGVLSGYSVSGYIGIIVTSLLIVILTNWKVGISVTLIAWAAVPFFSEQITRLINDMWAQQNAVYGGENGIIGLIKLGKDIYGRGVGVGSAPFLDIYSKYALSDGEAFYHIKTILRLGSFVLLAALWYLVKTLRKGVVKLFKSKGDEKLILSATISSLIGIAVMSFFGINWLNARTLILYWAVIGIAAGVSTMASKEERTGDFSND